MGIKGLWTILTPFCERKPLFELQGKTVAVDLSCWICEAQNVSEYSVQPRMYLRNLYFRTCYLLLMDVQPVFVLEGKAPELKFQTIANRNEIQFKGARPKSDKVKTGKDRTRFHFVLKQCEEMLKFMGIACVTGSGEAESMCAYLNEDNLVAGCISQDSDCFAYGARVVFRNFSISHQGSFAASGGAVDIYNIEKVNNALNFGRNKIITLALLCGSDYNDGVHGVGKDSAIKFMNKYSDSEILDRMRSWKNKKSFYSELETKISDKNVCSSCGHNGKVQSHTKSGCMLCKTTKGCDFTRFREQRLDIKNELQIRSKALMDSQFPNEDLINEFLVKKDSVKELDLKWRQPNLNNFVKFTVKYLGWEELYSFEKLLPILTRWQIKNHKFVFDKLKRNSISEIKGIIFPKCIKKARNPKGVPSYEIIWEDRKNYFEHLIPKEQIEEYLENKKNDLDFLWSTIEPKYLIEAAYPDLVNEFLDKKGKKGKKRQKTVKEIDCIAETLLNTSISEPKVKKSRVRRKKSPKTTKTLDSFLNLQSQNVSFDLNASKFDDSNTELDLSLIIDDITSRSPKLPEKIKKLALEAEKSEEMLNGSCFFGNFDQIDLFEQTFNKNNLTESESDSEEVKNSEVMSDSEDVKNSGVMSDSEYVKNSGVMSDSEDVKNSGVMSDSEYVKNSEVKSDSEDVKNSEVMNDTFDENYVSLFDRIQKHRNNTINDM